MVATLLFIQNDDSQNTALEEVLTAEQFKLKRVVDVTSAIKLIDDAVLIFVGDGDVIPLLKAQVETENLQDKVLFFGKRPYHELMNFTMLSDLGLSLDKNSNINYQFSLPNKVFDYIHAGIPLLVSDLIEVKYIVNHYQVGLVVTEHAPEALANAMKRIIFDDQLSAKFKTNAIQAAKTLNWENETKTLDEIYG